jgi:hypothetical protein
MRAAVESFTMRLPKEDFEEMMNENLDLAAKVKFIDSASEARKRDFSKIVSFLNRKNITKLFHFTHITNLESILSNGFQTRKFLDSNLNQFQATDPHRLDGFPESISFSIGEPNRLLFARKNYDFENQLVLLEVSANSLLTQNFAAFPSNAASGFFKEKIVNDPERYMGIKSLEGLYLNIDLREKARLSSDVPTDTQSELLFFDEISPNAIQRVHIPSHFPLVMLPTVHKLRLASEPSLFELRCECRLFDRQEGPFRRYSIGWEENGQ